MDLEFRDVKESDLDWLYKLRFQTMSEYIEKSGDQFTRKSQMERIMKDFNSINIVRINNQDAGMFKVKRKIDGWEIIQIQILPEYQGLGVGTKLIQDCQKEAQKKGVSIRLSVLKVNPAKSLYEKLGFKIIKEKEKSYKMCFSA